MWNTAQETTSRSIILRIQESEHAAKSSVRNWNVREVARSRGAFRHVSDFLFPFSIPKRNNNEIGIAVIFCSNRGTTFSFVSVHPSSKPRRVSFRVSFAEAPWLRLASPPRPPVPLLRTFPKMGQPDTESYSDESRHESNVARSR